MQIRAIRPIQREMVCVRRLGIVVATAAAMLVGAAAEAARPVVAVFGLQDNGTRLKQRDLDRLLDFIGASLTESGRYLVVPREEVKAALNRQKAESYKQCYAQSCQIDIGKELAAEMSLAGTVSRFGGRCIVSLKLFDLAKATQEAAGTGTGKCDEDSVFTSVTTALGKLTGRAVGGGTGATPAVVVAPKVEGADYGDVDAEIRAAAAKAAQEATEQKARENAASKDWEKIQKWVSNDKLDPTRRTSILEKFLTQFDSDNPHASEAQALLQKLRTAGGMVSVPAGEFYMGCNERVDSECDDDEKPGKTVHVGAFRIDTTEVTVAAYERCVGAGACSSATFQTKSDSGGCNWGHLNRGTHPMNCVTWTGAESYCKWAGKRLPSEKEWEKAARGTDGRKYPWGNAKVSCAHAVIDAGGNGCGRDSTWPVGSKPNGASPYGVQDMIGNVVEWVADWYAQSENRSIRGGSWNGYSKDARASCRYGFDPGLRVNRVGFRCAQSE